MFAYTSDRKDSVSKSNIFKLTFLSFCNFHAVIFAYACIFAIRTVHKDLQDVINDAPFL